MSSSGNNQQQKLVFFGNERLATGVTTDAPILRGLIKAGYSVKALVVSHAQAKSRSSRNLEVLDVANEHGIEVVIVSQKLSDLHEKLKSLQASAGILAAFGKIVPQSTIDIFPKGIINVHPSLLPQHRGPTPLESVILDGSKTTGVSIMQLVKAMDAGPVFAYSETKLSGQETKQELADKLSELGAAMLVEVLPLILSGELVAKPQDDSSATYDQLIKKSDGRLDWSKPAAQLEREVRAFAGWPKSTAELAGQDVIITKAQVSADNVKPGQVKSDDKYLSIGCAKGSLKILRLKPAGKQEMDAEQFIRGYRNKL